ncbi:MAG TPA: hypothetical protein VK324_02005 [Tepidisphaeraceae bacterium]|nr:hypothetical protein [Tepidisphaeraceae bacterium]
MDANDVRQIFMQRFNVRLEPEMCTYVLRRLKTGQPLAATAETLPVMGGNARTGVPVRYLAPVSSLTGQQDEEEPVA